MKPYFWPLHNVQRGALSESIVSWEVSGVGDVGSARASGLTWDSVPELQKPWDWMEGSDAVEGNLNNSRWGRPCPGGGLGKVFMARPGQ